MTDGQIDNLIEFGDLARQPLEERLREVEAQRDAARSQAEAAIRSLITDRDALQARLTLAAKEIASLDQRRLDAARAEADLSGVRAFVATTGGILHLFTDEDEARAFRNWAWVNKWGSFNGVEVHRKVAGHKPEGTP